MPVILVFAMLPAPLCYLIHYSLCIEMHRSTIIYTSVLLCITHAKTAADQITMRLRNHSGHDRHAAITTSITNAIATSIIPDITTSVLLCSPSMFVRVCASYQGSRQRARLVSYVASLSHGSQRSLKALGWTAGVNAVSSRAFLRCLKGLVQKTWFSLGCSRFSGRAVPHELTILEGSGSKTVSFLRLFNVFVNLDVWLDRKTKSWFSYGCWRVWSNNRDCP